MNPLSDTNARSPGPRVFRVLPLNSGCLLEDFLKGIITSGFKVSSFRGLGQPVSGRAACADPGPACTHCRHAIENHITPNPYTPKPLNPKPPQTLNPKPLNPYTPKP